jgi:hypothetical protein
MFSMRFYKLWMANNDSDAVWTLGAVIRFGSLELFVGKEGAMIRAPEAPTPSTSGLPNIARGLGDLQLGGP